MADGSGAGAKRSNEDSNLPIWWATLLPVFLGATLLVSLLFVIDLEGLAGIWQKLAALGVLVLISLLAAVAIRGILDPLVRVKRIRSSASADPVDLARDRMAPFVLAIGGAAVVVLTLTMVVSFAVLALAGHNDALANGEEQSLLGPLATKIDTVLLGVFGAVLPIVATWVGTVIAFYFTNESYKQAARTALEASGGLRPSGPSVTSIMVPYNQIPKEPVKSRADAEAVKLKDISKLFGERGTRVMIVEEAAKNPVYVIRKKLVPQDLSADPDVAKLRRDDPNLAADTKHYGFVPEATSILEAKRAMQENQLEDIFVTRAGQPTEEVLGWITGEMMKGV